MPNHAANEQAVFVRIRAEMEKHLLTHGAPEEIHDFLARHWARLMTGIFMAKGNRHADWLAGWDAVNALLWSLSPKTGREDAEKMLRMLPTLLSRLHEGCAALAIAAAERDALFERLALMHAAVAREGLRCQADQMQSVTRLAGEADVDEKPADLSGLHPAEGSTPTQRGGASALPVLKPGDRVRFAINGDERLMVLNWISPVGGMFLFTNEHGLDARTFTRARLAERFQAGTAMPAN